MTVEEMKVEERTESDHLPVSFVLRKIDKRENQRGKKVYNEDTEEIF